MNNKRREDVGCVVKLLSSANSMLRSVQYREELSLSNMPDNLQSSELYCSIEDNCDIIEEAVGCIEDVISMLEDI